MTNQVSIRPAVAADFGSLEGAKMWIKGMVRAGLAFHFEDDPATIGNMVTDQAGRKQWVHTFTEAEAPLVRDRVERLYDFSWGAYECPIGFEIECTNWKYGGGKEPT